MKRDELIKKLNDKFGCRCGFDFPHFKDVVRIATVVDFISEEMKKEKESNEKN